MGIISKYNKGNVFGGIDTSKMEFKTLAELYRTNGSEKIYKVKGLFISTKSKFGPSPVAITEDCLVNLPKYMVDEVDDILKDFEVIDAIKHDKVGFIIRPYTNSYSRQSGKTFYSITWLDI